MTAEPRPPTARLLGSNQDTTGGAIAPPFQILRALVGRPDAVIFDVGASTGSSIARFLSAFERPTIHSFEPQALAFGELHRVYGGRADMHLNNHALGDRVGIASLHRGNFADTASLLAMAPDSWWLKSLNINAGDASITVALDTIDHYCAEHGVAMIDLLKLDIQGTEPECLRGAQAMLGAGAVRVVLTEIIVHRAYSRPGSFAAIEAVLAPHGFRLFTLFDVIMAPDGELLQLDAVYTRV
jgi:FkbM family methyltransferase